MKERWNQPQMQIQTNQQEKTAIHQAFEELTTKAKLEYGADHASLGATLEQIQELIEAKWPATQDAPMVREVIHGRNCDHAAQNHSTRDQRQRVQT